MQDNNLLTLRYTEPISLITATTRAAAAAPSTSTQAVPATVTAPYGNPFTCLSHSIEKLDGSMATGKSNYVAWKFHIVRILMEKGLDQCNMCTCSGNGTQERAVQDLLCLVDFHWAYLI